jgi:hypothetical protein
MHLSPGGQRFRDDDGSADLAVARALAQYHAGEGSERAALVALAVSRLLVPVVALLTEAGADGAEKNSEMALPTLIGRDGRPAIMAFTCAASLANWRADARPVPAEAIRVWRAAVAEHGERPAVVIDVAGPVPFVVDGARLTALAAGQQPPEPYDDPDVRAAVEAVLAAEPQIAGARLGPPLSPDTDLHIQLLVAPDARARTQAGTQAAVQRAAERVSAALAPRFRRGIDITARN